MRKLRTPEARERLDQLQAERREHERQSLGVTVDEATEAVNRLAEMLRRTNKSVDMLGSEGQLG